MFKQTENLEFQVDSTQKYEVSRGKSILLLMVLFLLYALAYMDRSVIAVVMEQMKNELGLTDGQTGLFHTIFMLGVGLLLLPCGMLVDRWSRRKAVALMAVTWSIATFLTGMASSFATVLMGRAVTSAGESGFASGGTAWVSLTFPKKMRAKVLGIFNMAIPMGGALGVGLGGYLVSVSGNWRTPFFVFAIPGIILGIIALFLPDYVTAKQESSKSKSKQIKSDIAGLLRTRSMVFAALGQSFITFLMFALSGWLPTLFIRVYHLDVGKAGLYTGLVYILSMVGAIVGGIVSDRWQQRNPRGQYMFVIVALSLATIMFASAFMLFDRSITFAVVFCAAVFFFGNTTTPAYAFITQDVVPPKLRATAFALCGIVLFSVAAWGPVITGTLSDILGGGPNGLVKAFLFLSPIGLLGVISYLIGIQSYLSDREGIVEDVLMEQ